MCVHLTIEQNVAFIAFRVPPGRKHACADVPNPAGSLQSAKRNEFRPKTWLSESHVSPFHEMGYRQLSAARKKKCYLGRILLDGELGRLYVSQRT
jgi:hypothetical protein